MEEYMMILNQLVSNKVLICAVSAWFAAQVLKTFINFAVKKKLELERMVGAGGMPSAHSATVCALTITIAKTMGVNSTEFAIAFVLATVVIYDAMGVRRAAGQHAKEINKILFKMENFILKDQTEEKKEIAEKQLKELLGHTPIEVIGGVLLGILVAMVI